MCLRVCLPIAATKVHKRTPVDGGGPLHQRSWSKLPDREVLLACWGRHALFATAIFQCCAVAAPRSTLFDLNLDLRTLLGPTTTPLHAECVLGADHQFDISLC